MKQIILFPIAIVIIFPAFIALGVASYLGCTARCVVRGVLVQLGVRRLAEWYEK